MGADDQRKQLEPLDLLKGRAQVPQDAAAEDEWPTLMAVLLPVWKEGKCRRQAGSLRLRIVGGYFLVTVHCPTEGMECTMTTDTLVNLLPQLETFLQSGASEWIPDFETLKKTRRVRVD